MQQRLHALSCHADATRFEIEDALVRDAPGELLAEETSIHEIGIDLGLVHLSQSTADPLGDINSFVTISAGEPSDAVAEPLAALAAVAARVSASWTLQTENITELQKAWVGTATPGPKVTAVFDSSAAGSATYQDNIVQIIREMTSAWGDVGSRALFLDQGQDAPFSTIASFWFPTVSATQEALESDVLKKLTEAGNISSDSIGLYQGTEHRVFPNPNIWSTTTGLQRPGAD